MIESIGYEKEVSIEKYRYYLSLNLPTYQSKQLMGQKVKHMNWIKKNCKAHVILRVNIHVLEN